MAGQPKTKKNSVSSGKVKKVKACEPIVTEAIADSCETRTSAQKEELMEGRRYHAFASNKLRLESLISEDCFLSDIELAISPPPSVKNNMPTPKFIRTMDGWMDKAVEDSFQDDVHKRKAEEIYLHAVSSTLKHVAEVVSDEALIAQITSCQKLIFLLLQDSEERVSAVETIDAAEMAARVSFYFDECDKRHRSYTVPGLAYAIGFMHRKQMLSFVAENQDLIPAYIIARALMKIEDQRNIEIISGGGMMAGHKLDLATNFDWNDAKAKNSKDDGAQNITNNIINMNSLPPTDSMSIDEWQTKFLNRQKEHAKPALDVTPEKK